jgi:hypothetical protein
MWTKRAVSVSIPIKPKAHIKHGKWEINGNTNCTEWKERPGSALAADMTGAEIPDRNADLCRWGPPENRNAYWDSQRSHVALLSWVSWQT